MSLSVLMTLYKNDSPEHFLDAFDSILGQTLPPDEIVLVVDGPIGAGLENALKLCEGKAGATPLRVFRLPSNRGLGSALRFGLSRCAHDLVVRHDSDDISLPDRFRLQADFMEARPEVSVSSGAIYEFAGTTGKITNIKRVPVGMRRILAYSRTRNPINHPCAILRKKDALAVGGYRKALLFEDYYLWLRLLAGGFSLDNLDEPLVYFRSDGYMSRRRGWKYAVKEALFLIRLKRDGLLKFINPTAYVGRIVIRLLPAGVVGIIYGKYLRRGE
jgi:glycosyltransferase involved in cell wall biosynthesis